MLHVRSIDFNFLEVNMKIANIIYGWSILMFPEVRDLKNEKQQQFSISWALVEEPWVS